MEGSNQGSCVLGGNITRFDTSGFGIFDDKSEGAGEIVSHRSAVPEAKAQSLGGGGGLKVEKQRVSDESEKGQDPGVLSLDKAHRDRRACGASGRKVSSLVGEGNRTSGNIPAPPH